MNSENFHEYVKNPSMLHQVSYQELKSLVLQYPYSPNLRYLLLLKSLFEQSKDFDKNQVLASLSSPDRKKLRQLVKQYSRLREMQENYTLSEDFLELKDLSSLESMMDQLEAETVAPPKGAAVPPPPSPPPTLEDLEEMEDETFGFLEGLKGHSAVDEVAPDDHAEQLTTEAVLGEPEELDPSLSLEELVEQADTTVEEAPAEEVPVEDPALEEEDEQEQTEAPKPAAADVPLEITNETDAQPSPLPKSSFNAWLRQLKPPQAAILSTDLKDLSLNNKPSQHPEEDIAPDAKQIAEQSVEEDEEIASETLALLLEKQKLYAKAISMYEHLKLLYPEKSSLFAAKIEELNKNL
jgi:hypothetical protein